MTNYPTAGPPAAPARRRSRWPRVLLIVVLVLAVLLVVLDRGGKYVAERVAADNLQSSQHLPSRPDVTIHGVPFLTQFASGHYDHVSVDADGLPVADGAVRISHLHVDLNQLTVSRNFSTFHANSATATATLGYPELSRRLGIDVSYAGGNRIRASKSFDLPVVGTVSPTISVRPSLVNGALTFGTSTINGAGSQLGIVADALHKLFDVSIPLDGLPFDIKVRSLVADATGVHADLVGSDLTYSSNG